MTKPLVHARPSWRGWPAPGSSGDGSSPGGAPTPTPSAPGSTTGYFPPEAVWYRDVSTAALDPQSAAVIANLDRAGWGLGRMQIDFSIEVLDGRRQHAAAGLHPDRGLTSGPTATSTRSRCRPGAPSRARRATSAAATATAT